LFIVSLITVEHNQILVERIGSDKRIGHTLRAESLLRMVIERKCYEED